MSETFNFMSTESLRGGKSARRTLRIAPSVSWLVEMGLRVGKHYDDDECFEEKAVGEEIGSTSERTIRAVDGHPAKLNKLVTRKAKRRKAKSSTRLASVVVVVVSGANEINNTFKKDC